MIQAEDGRCDLQFRLGVRYIFELESVYTSAQPNRYASWLNLLTIEENMLSNAIGQGVTNATGTRTKSCR